MRKFTIFLAGILCVFVACNKQEAKAPANDQEEETTIVDRRSCGAYEVLEAQMAADPSLRTRMRQIEEHTLRVIENPSAYRLVNGIIEIPVVVHVIYRTKAENISDAQVASQIAVLNDDYQNLNADRTKLPAGSFQTVVSSGLKVHFTLAQTIHKSTKVVNWSTNDAVKSSASKGDDPVDPEHMLNIWTCRLGQSLLGYAQFPGGQPATDGVVILYSAFGSKEKYAGGTYSSPFDLGRTATHEVGHWMNLRHIWGDDNGACTGSDQVTDTPNQGSENYGSPAYPHTSCSNGAKGDMFMNYMDYVDDKSMYMFSTGQKDRMLATFAASGPRVSFATP
jgi:hypothetical protein